jgi:signal transduction histidine kinase
MKYFEERFGIQKIRLSDEEFKKLNNELVFLDYKRLTFIAFVSFIVCSLFLILDLLSVYGELKTYYLAFDIFFFIASSVVLYDSFKNDKKSTKHKNNYQVFLIRAYPVVMLIWATAISTLNPGSLLNIATYYFAIFLIASSFYIRFFQFIVYYFIISLTYILLSTWLKQPLLSDTLAFLSIGAILSMIFSTIFNSTRRNWQAALIKLNKANINLEYKVELRTTELRMVNENLENEISQRILIELRLKKALKTAETVNKLKSEFLANISHEVRTPLNAIIGFTEMMTEDGVTEERKKEFQKLVSSNTLYLLSTFDDIFDASYVRDEKFKPVNKPLNVDSFIDILTYETNGMVIKYNKPDLEKRFTKTDDPSIELITDEFFLKKAMTRLIDNAFKFTHSGSVEVGANFNNGSLQMYVSDTGIGIAEKDYKMIFQPFVQGDGSFSRGYGGSGLGLTIVKAIAESLKCTFHFETELGKGSTFYLIFSQDLFTRKQSF